MCILNDFDFFIYVSGVRKAVGGSWLSVSQGIAEDTSDLVSGFATIGDGLSESVKRGLGMEVFQIRRKEVQPKMRRMINLLLRRILTSLVSNIFYQKMLSRSLLQMILLV